jgi:drug/metabolite transporter (DMT)-like permease
LKKKTYLFLLADLSLLLVAAVWGLTFVTVKNAIALLPPFSFNFYRFSLAALVMIAIALLKGEKLRLQTVQAGLLVGFFLFNGYSFQTVGLAYTTAANAGFLTGLSVVLVPIVTVVLTRRRPQAGVMAGAACAACGLAVLSLADLAGFSAGDLLVLCCALFFALHIVFVGRFSPHHPTVWLVAVQIATVAVLSGLSGLLLEGGIQKPVVAETGTALLITALFATCLAFFTQNYMQRFTSPGHTAIIFASEPVFTAFFAVLLLRETLLPNTYLGGALIVAGMLLAELGNFFRPAKRQEANAGQKHNETKKPAGGFN